MSTLCIPLTRAISGASEVRESEKRKLKPPNLEVTFALYITLLLLSQIGKVIANQQCKSIS